MSAQQLLEIHPRELKFIFEVKKQSSCAIRLTNNTFHNVAFKVKTTSPKKYCVRPNVGIIMPRSSCEFTVTMQAQKVAPPDLVCKDKFLIQGTVVPVGTTEKDITPATFSKDDGNYVEEVKLRVALMSPPESPVLSPINGVLKQGTFSDDSLWEDPALSSVKVLGPPQKLTKDVELKMTNGQELKTEKDSELKPKREVVDVYPLKRLNDAELTPVMVAVNGGGLKSAKDEKLKPDMNVVNDELSRAAKDEVLKEEKDATCNELPKPTKDQGLKPDKNSPNLELPKPVRIEELKPEKDAPDVELPKPVKVEGLKPEKAAINIELPKPANNEELKPRKEGTNDELLKPTKDAEFPSRKDVAFTTEKTVEDPKLVGEIEELKSKLKALESKLNQAESTISKFTEERRSSIQERKILQEELLVLSRRTNLKKVQAGFPLLFVVMVAFVSVVLGYLSHP